MRNNIIANNMWKTFKYNLLDDCKKSHISNSHMKSNLLIINNHIKNGYFNETIFVGKYKTRLNISE